MSSDLNNAIKQLKEEINKANQQQDADSNEYTQFLTDEIKFNINTEFEKRIHLLIPSNISCTDMKSTIFKTCAYIWEKHSLLPVCIQSPIISTASVFYYNSDKDLLLVIDIWKTYEAYQFNLSVSDGTNTVECVLDNLEAIGNDKIFIGFMDSNNED